MITPPDCCPACGYVFELASTVSGEEVKPQPGDVTICFGCADVLVFGPDMLTRAITADERAAWPTDYRNAVELARLPILDGRFRAAGNGPMARA